MNILDLNQTSKKIKLSLLTFWVVMLQGNTQLIFDEDLLNYSRIHYMDNVKTLDSIILRTIMPKYYMVYKEEFLKQGDREVKI